MNLEVILGGLLAVVLVGLAVFFIWQQKKTLQGLKSGQPPGREDRLYLRKQVNRRLVCSFLMMVIAGMLVGWVFVDRELSERPLDQDDIDRAEPGKIFKEKTEIGGIKILYWVAILVVLFAILFLAIIDLMATARFGLRQHRQLEAERKAMLEEEVARWRKK